MATPRKRERYQVSWLPDTEVKGDAYDAPILGYRLGTSNIVPLSKAEGWESFDFAAFNEGDYDGSVADKRAVENIASGATSWPRVRSCACNSSISS